MLKSLFPINTAKILKRMCSHCRNECQDLGILLSLVILVIHVIAVKLYEAEPRNTTVIKNGNTQIKLHNKLL